MRKQKQNPEGKARKQEIQVQTSAEQFETERHFKRLSRFKQPNCSVLFKLPGIFVFNTNSEQSKETDSSSVHVKI